jgi:hypothetical protein
MFITDLTVPGFYLISVIDSGAHDDISIDDVRASIDNHTIFTFLKDRLGRGYFIHLNAEQKRELNEHWESLNNVVTAEELGATRRGISLILGYMLEGIQNGTSRDGRLLEQHRK